MRKSMRSVVGVAVVRLMRPLVRVLIHHGISFQAFAETAKWIYVDVANQQFQIPGRKMSKSRIAVITGLTRREVDRLTQSELPPMDSSQEFYNRALRVFMGWLEDEAFTDSHGRPLPLPVTDDGPLSFSELVRRYSGNQPVRAILDELERVGAVALEGNMAVIALTSGEIARTGQRSKAQEMSHQAAGVLDQFSRELCSTTPSPALDR